MELLTVLLKLPHGVCNVNIAAAAAGSSRQQKLAGKSHEYFSNGFQPMSQSTDLNQ